MSTTTWLLSDEYTERVDYMMSFVVPPGRYWVGDVTQTIPAEDFPKWLEVAEETDLAVWGELDSQRIAVAFRVDDGEFVSDSGNITLVTETGMLGLVSHDWAPSVSMAQGIRTPVYFPHETELFRINSGSLALGNHTYNIQ